MSTEIRDLPYKGPLGSISSKTLEVHHDKLYIGYAKKKDEIQEKLAKLDTESMDGANQTYSYLRGLKNGETFAVNGVYLHELYFENMGGNGEISGDISEAINKEYGSYDKFKSYFAACAMAARGWVVLSWDTHEKALRIYNCDAHNQGGVWGALPLLILDVYEHAYFMDFASDRKTYIQEFFNQINWETVNNRFQKVIKNQ